MLTNLLVVLVGVIIRAGIDYNKIGKEFKISEKWKDYALTFVVMVTLSVFIKDAIIQRLLLIISCLSFRDIINLFSKKSDN